MEETDITNLLKAGKPLVTKEFGFMDGLKYKKYGKAFDAIKKMDGTKTTEELVKETGAEMDKLNELMRSLKAEGCLLYVDEGARLAFAKMGQKGIDAYNLINGKRKIEEISEAVGIQSQDLIALVKDLPNVENNNGILIK